MRKDRGGSGTNINRRDAIKAGALGALAASGLAGALPRKPPNMVFILSDDHRWDHMGFMGHPFIQTPYLDRIASEGVHFKNSFVVTSLCSPSRATFMTGQYPHAHGVKNNLTPWNNENVTFLELLKGVGYRTAFIGKWHMPGRLPELRGVDLFVTFTVQGGQGRYMNCPLVVNGKREPSRKEYITEELTDRAIEWMAENREGPFCLFLAFKAAHHQFIPHPDVAGIYNDVELSLPDEADQWITSVNGNLFYGTMGPLSLHYRNYCETITGMDREIGRLLEWLDGAELANNTLLAYTSDNGFFWGEHRLVDKRWGYEESIRVPLLVRAPWIEAARGEREQMVTNADLAPAALAVAAIPPRPDMEGKSWTPILSDPATPGRKAWLYEYHRDYPYAVPGITAVRTSTHIYMTYENGRPPELYNVIEDPRQKNNLIGAPEGEKLRQELAAMLEDLKSGRM